MDSIETLNDDTIREVAMQLTYREITRLCGTSQRFRIVVCGDDFLWRRLLMRDYGVGVVPKNRTPFRYYQDLYGRWYIMGEIADLHASPGAPVSIEIPGDRRIIDISIEMGLAIIVTEDNRLWCLGEDFTGITGAVGMYDVPTPMIGTEHIRAVSVSVDSSLVVLDLHGNVWNRWVDMDDVPQPFVRYGFPSRAIEVQMSVSTSVVLDENRDIWVLKGNYQSYVKWDLGFKVAMYSIDLHKMMFIDTYGDLYSWGNNNHGELGLAPGSIDNMVKINSDRKVKWVSCGYDHSGVIDTDGNLWMAGSNQYYQLGDTEAGESHRFRMVKRNMTKVYCGPSDTLAISVGGGIWVAGDNLDGRLGVEISYPHPNRYIGLSVIGVNIPVSDNTITFRQLPGLYGWDARLGNNVTFIKLDPQ